MKLVCFEGNKQTESVFFGNNYIFGKRFENTPRYRVFFYSIDVFFQSWNNKLLILGPIWFSNVCLKHSRPIRLQDILNLDIAKTIWGIKLIFCTKVESIEATNPWGFWGSFWPGVPGNVLNAVNKSDCQILETLISQKPCWGMDALNALNQSDCRILETLISQKYLNKLILRLKMDGYSLDQSISRILYFRGRNLTDLVKIHKMSKN